MCCYVDRGTPVPSPFRSVRNHPTGLALRFSKLRLTGFKSFVDPTDLIIADGLTGVVGPKRLWEIEPAGGAALGDGRKPSDCDAWWRNGRCDLCGCRDQACPQLCRSQPAHRQFANDSRRRGSTIMDSLEIVRRITRDVGSAYKSGGKDVRARDVQMLFADASTGLIRLLWSVRARLPN